jgi:hypothetical protein
MANIRHVAYPMSIGYLRYLIVVGLATSSCGSRPLDGSVQQNLQLRRIALVVLTGSTRWSRLRQHTNRIATAVASTTSGSCAEVEIHFEPKLRRSCTRGSERYASNAVPNRVRFLFAEGLSALAKCLTRQDRLMVTLFFTSWNRIGQWLRHVDGLRQRPEPSAAARACAIGNVAASLGTENP